MLYADRGAVRRRGSRRSGRACEAGGRGAQDGDAVFGGRLRDPRRDRGHPCIPDFAPARLGGRKGSGADGAGADEGFAEGTLEPDQFSAHLSRKECLYGAEGKV